MPASPVRVNPARILLAAIAVIAFFACVADGALARSEPRLGEEQARRIARGIDEVDRIVEEHNELEIYSNFDAGRDLWEVSWRNPFNSRRLIAVQIDDATGRVLYSHIDEEAYMDILPSLSEKGAIEIARSQEKVAGELEGVEEPSPSAKLGEDGVWTVSFHSGSDEVARVLIDDISGTVNEVMVGPQVAWQMARGYKGAFGRIINEPYVWLPLCFLFIFPFIDIRRPFRLFHLDLLVLLSFTISHYYFNQGEIFTSVPLAYPPLVWLFLRLAWIWLRPGAAGPGPGPDPGVGPGPRPHLNLSPRAMLIVLALMLAFRIAINIADSNVVDVGYSGVIGGHQILNGDTPYGNMPADNENGDTYGPLNYLLYVPFVKIFPWSGEWDHLPAAHAAAIFFDLVTVAGMFLAGRRLAGRGAPGNRLGLALAWAWTAFPYTTFVQSCNVNDTIVAAFLVWGFVFLASAPLSGALLGLAAQIKFFPAIAGPLWASYPDARRGWGRRIVFVASFTAALAVTMPVVFLGDGNLGLFWEKTLGWQLGRESPFSIWGQHPDLLGRAQRISQYFLIALALGSYFVPLKKNLTRVAAATAALVVGFQIVETHWFYLYIPWFFPLAFTALLMNSEKMNQRIDGARPVS